jgi:[NiFe] hydrogenase diaphorase moiety large subunit
MVGPDAYDRTICYEDLATGGSVMVFGPDRDVLWVAQSFMEFFIDESCGYCTPCRVGNVLLKQGLDQIIKGRGNHDDLDYLRELGETVRTASRCGLGQTSPNPILSTLESFRQEYEDRVQQPQDGFNPDFDLDEALSEAASIIEKQ